MGSQKTLEMEKKPEEHQVELEDLYRCGFSRPDFSNSKEALRNVLAHSYEPRFEKNFINYEFNIQFDDESSDKIAHYNLQISTQLSLEKKLKDMKLENEQSSMELKNLQMQNTTLQMLQQAIQNESTKKQDIKELTI